MALSGGQQQRLCIARTIAPAPDVILLDEPTASLDPQGTQRIEELLFELKQRLHHRDRDPQHAAGGAGVGHHHVLLPGHHGRDRAHPADLHRAAERADRGLHHRDGSDDRPSRAPTVRHAQGHAAPRQPPTPPARSAARPAIDVRELPLLVRRRGRRSQDLNFAIERKAVTAIIGPSGCGKSTFLRSINRLNDLIAGDPAPGRHPGRGAVGVSRRRPTWSRSASGSAWCSSGRTRSPRSIFDNVAYGPALNAWCRSATCPTWWSAASGRRRCGTR